MIIIMMMVINLNVLVTSHNHDYYVKLVRE